MNEPNTRSGFCHECSMPANIWNVTHNAWECEYCNWLGAFPDREPKLKTIYGAEHNGNG